MIALTVAQVPPSQCVCFSKLLSENPVLRGEKSCPDDTATVATWLASPWGPSKHCTAAVKPGA